MKANPSGIGLLSALYITYVYGQHLKEYTGFFTSALSLFLTCVINRISFRYPSRRRKTNGTLVTWMNICIAYCKDDKRSRTAT
jgi:hypothetical protein